MALTKKFFKNGSKKNSTRMKTKKKSMKGGSQKPQPQQQKVLGALGASSKQHTGWSRTAFKEVNPVVLKEGEHPFSVVKTQSSPQLIEKRPAITTANQLRTFLTGTSKVSMKNQPRINQFITAGISSKKNSITEQNKLIQFIKTSTGQAQVSPEARKYIIKNPAEAYKVIQTIIGSKGQYMAVQTPAEPVYMTIVP